MYVFVNRVESDCLNISLSNQNQVLYSRALTIPEILSSLCKSNYLVYCSGQEVRRFFEIIFEFSKTLTHDDPGELHFYFGIHSLPV